jgi:hypothetical protein
MAIVVAFPSGALATPTSGNDAVPLAEVTARLPMAECVALVAAIVQLSASSVLTAGAMLPSREVCTTVTAGAGVSACSSAVFSGEGSAEGSSSAASSAAR